MGADNLGNVVGLLQCKWTYYGGELQFESNAEKTQIKRFVATLMHQDDLKVASGTILFNRSKIAELLRKHADKLPWAQTLRIGI